MTLSCCNPWSHLTGSGRVRIFHSKNCPSKPHQGLSEEEKAQHLHPARGSKRPPQVVPVDRDTDRQHWEWCTDPRCQRCSYIDAHLDDERVSR